MTKSKHFPERSRDKAASTPQRREASGGSSDLQQPIDPTSPGDTLPPQQDAMRRIDERGGVSHGLDTPDLAGITVLLLCPSNNDRIVLQQILRHLGAEIVMADDVAALRGSRAASKVDVGVISANSVREHDLAELCAIRRTVPPGERLPILGLMADREYQPVDWADAVIAAPVMSAHDLGGAISTLLDPPHADIDTPPSHGGPVSPGPVSPGIVEKRLRGLVRLAGPDHCDELLHQLDSDLSHVATVLQAATGQLDFAEVRAQAHVLVSLAGTVDAAALLEIATDLNAAARQEDANAIKRLAIQADSGIAALLKIVRHETAQ